MVENRRKMAFFFMDDNINNRFMAEPLIICFGYFDEMNWNKLSFAQIIAYRRKSDRLIIWAKPYVD